MSTISARAGNQSISIKVRRPSWDKVYEGYPKIERYGIVDDLDGHSVFISIFGEDYDTSIFRNACATRLSLGLLNAEVKIKGEYPIRTGVFKKKLVITSAANMIKWLNKNFGNPDETIKSPQTYQDIIKIIGNRKGIYAMMTLSQILCKHPFHLKVIV